MKCLSPCVNVIPVIGKADTFTPGPRTIYIKIIEDIDYYNIPIYNFLEEDDEETVEENSELWALLPFAIVKSEEEIVVNGRTVYGRQYPWGVVEVISLHCCSFHLQDLKEIIHNFLYKNYRTKKLS
ncbi:Septin-type guanine nucleotide-binding (G) domain-containing protein, partial [Gigaspora rosea]